MARLVLADGACSSAWTTPSLLRPKRRNALPDSDRPAGPKLFSASDASASIRPSHSDAKSTRKPKSVRLDHKIEKLIVAGERTPGVEWLLTHAYSGADGIALIEYAPFGVIGAITPVTHSLPTLASNAISMLAAGNAVVFNPHPAGAGVARHGVQLFNQAIEQAIALTTC
jgi:hypothetical protein